MIRSIFLALGFSIGSWASAHGCSPVQEVISGVQFYSSLQPSYYDSWNDTEISVGLVYAKQVNSRNKTVVTGFDFKKSRKPFVKVKFNLVKDISGGFEKDKKTWFPKMDAAGQEKELALKEKTRDFSFWDTRGISIPQRYGYDSNSSCGPMPKNTLLPNQYYLHFKKGNRTVGLEIVTGADDPLVKDFVDIYSRQNNTKILRIPEDYFTEMAGYAEIEIIKCPTEENYMVGFGFISGDNDEHLSQDYFNLISSFETKLGDLRPIDFLEYISKIGTRDAQCQLGDKYLVLDKLSKDYDRRISFTVTHPQHRYLKIKNGTINSQDILTKITILTNTSIELASAKNWIKEANSK